MRDAIGPSEEDRLVKALKNGKGWDEVRGMLPGVDPEALDRGFKERCFRLAGMGVEPVLPVIEEPKVEARAPVVRKGKG